MKSILFVCTGNTCRSPMAHFYLQHKLEEIGKQNDFLVDSCGMMTLGGESATMNSIKAIENYGVDMSKHRSKAITDIDIYSYDIILCMTMSHKLNLLLMYKDIENKIFTLKEYINDKNNEDLDIKDPFGLNITRYEDCAKEIVENVNKLIEKI